MANKAKPDYLDLDKDGNRKEPMKKAARDAKKKTNEGLGELADMAERDHEVQMARADLYKIAKYAIKLHDILKNITEEQGLEGWVQAKITKSSDYISAVYHNLDYDQKFGDGGAAGTSDPSETIGMKMSTEGKKYKSDAQRKAIHANKAKTESTDTYKASLHSKLQEKATSKAQQQAAGIALAAKRKGETPKGKGAAADMAKMSTKELEKFAGTKHKGLPKSKS